MESSIVKFYTDLLDKSTFSLRAFESNMPVRVESVMKNLEETSIGKHEVSKDCSVSIFLRKWHSSVVFCARKRKLEYLNFASYFKANNGK